jgi:hypothetical protein
MHHVNASFKCVLDSLPLFQHEGSSEKLFQAEIWWIGEVHDDEISDALLEEKGSTDLGDFVSIPSLHDVRPRLASKSLVEFQPRRVFMR